MARPLVPLEVLSKVGKFNTAEWVTAFSPHIKDNVYKELINDYGYGDTLFDFLNMANQTTNMDSSGMANRELIVKSEGTMEATVTTEEQIATGAAGADIVFRVSTDDIVGGKCPVRVTDDIVIPAKYQTSGEARAYHVTTVTVNSATDIDITMTPFIKAGTTVAAAQVSVAIPAGTTFTINGGSSGIGSGLPEGRTRNWFERRYKTKIIKEAVDFEGGIGGYQAWTDHNNWRFKSIGGGKSVAQYLGSTQMEFDFNKKLGASVFFSEENDNTGLTSVSASNGTNAIPSTKGIWNWAESDGQDLTFAGSLDVEDLGDVNDLLRSQLVTTTDLMFWNGSTLGRQLQNICLNYMKEYSGGTSLVEGMKKLGVNIETFVFNGLTFHFKSCADFSNPQRFGGDAYEFANSGLIYPLTQGKTRFGNKEPEMTPSVMISYLKDGGVIRDNLFGTIDGTTGHAAASNEYDVRKLYQLSEFAVLVLRPNQLIRVRPE